MAFRRDARAAIRRDKDTISREISPQKECVRHHADVRAKAHKQEFRFRPHMWAQKLRQCDAAERGLVNDARALRKWGDFRRKRPPRAALFAMRNGEELAFKGLMSQKKS